MRKSLNVAARSAAALAVLVAAGCGSSDSGSSAGDGSEADVEGAKAFIADYVGKPSAFPVDEPLEKKVPAGSEIVFFDIGTSIAAIQWALFEGAAGAMGLEPVRVKTAPDAKSISDAMDSVVSQEPAGVVIIGADPALYSRQLDQLRENGTTVVASSIQNGEEYGFGPVTYGGPDVQVAGELMAAWTIARGEGDVEEVAIYNIPELAFSAPMAEAATAKLEELCPDCEVRTVDVSITKLGAGADQNIISDLQANPNTTAAILATDELANGLPVALDTAGIELTTVGPGPSPANLQQIKDGTEDAALGIDLAVQVWALVDQFAREHTGQELTGPMAEGAIVKQFVTQDDVDDPSKGFSAYPDFAERFTKLWSAAE